MRQKNESIQQLAAVFEQQACWQISSLAEVLKISTPTVRRHLLKVGYYRSITDNGKWYTLSSIPSFNHSGLWHHEAIVFSRQGSLTKTLVHLVNRSSSGMTAMEIGHVLHCRCHTILVSLSRRGLLQRHKAGNSFVYLSNDSSIFQKQLNAISQKEASTMRAIPSEVAVLVFAEFIRKTSASFDQLSSALLHKSNINISVSQIDQLFKLHNLKKTKNMLGIEP